MTLLKKKNAALKSLGREPLFTIRDGWNLGIGLWLASLAIPFLVAFIGLVAFFVAWVIMLILGYT